MVESMYQVSLVYSETCSVMSLSFDRYQPPPHSVCVCGSRCWPMIKGCRVLYNPFLHRRDGSDSAEIDALVCV